MTNPAYEATNSDVEKLIKYARINAECGEHASPEEMLKLVAALENERKQKNSWKNLAKKSISERSVDIEALLSARQRIAELETAPNGMMQLSNELAEMKQKCAELQEQKDKWAAWAISLGAKADELESRPLCVKSNDAMREVAPLCVKLPDSSSKAFWSGTGKTEQFHPETYKRWVKEAIERAGDIAGVQVEVK